MLAKHPEVIRKVKEIETRLNGDGKVLVRPSGTEPLIRIAVSAPSEAIVDQIIAEIIATIDTFSKNK
jgi:phosphoglucosamine mutase